MNFTFKISPIHDVIIIFVLCIALSVCTFFLGASCKLRTINERIQAYPNNQEECFTRKEVDTFLYGDVFTEVYNQTE